MSSYSDKVAATRARNEAFRAARRQEEIAYNERSFQASKKRKRDETTALYQWSIWITKAMDGYGPEVEQAFRVKMREWHPDVEPGENLDVWKQAWQKYIMEFRPHWDGAKTFAHSSAMRQEAEALEDNAKKEAAAKKKAKLDNPFGSDISKDWDFMYPGTIKSKKNKAAIKSLKKLDNYAAKKLDADPLLKDALVALSEHSKVIKVTPAGKGDSGFPFIGDTMDVVKTKPKVKGGNKKKKKKMPKKKQLTKKQQAIIAARRRQYAPRYYSRRYSRGGYNRPIISTPWSTLVGYGGYKRKYKDLMESGACNCPTSVGGKVGAWIGDGIQSGIKYLTGMGEYQIQQNSLYHGTDPPKIVNSPQGEEVIIRHREFLGDLNSGPLSGSVTAFDLNFYAINPGNSKLFPWLSNIASNFQEWELRGMVVQLKSLSSEYAANSVLGSYFVGTQYNALSPPPLSKRELENLEYSTSAKPSESIIHGIECARHLSADTHLYVAQDSNYDNGDRRFYDLGNIYIGSAGLNVADAPIAEIWVSYEVALYKPQLQAPITKTWVAANTSGAITAVFPWGLNAGQLITPQPGSYMGITANIDTTLAQTMVFNFPAIEAIYKIDCYRTFDAAVTPTLTATVTYAPGVGGINLFAQPLGGDPFANPSFLAGSTATARKAISTLVAIDPKHITDQGVWARLQLEFNAFATNNNNGWIIVIESWNPKVSLVVQ